MISGCFSSRGYPGSLAVRNPPANAETQETWVQSLCWEDSLEEEMATYSNILVWEIPWTEEPGGLQSMWVSKSQTHDLVTTATISSNI